MAISESRWGRSGKGAERPARCRKTLDTMGIDAENGNVGAELTRSQETAWGCNPRPFSHLGLTYTTLAITSWRALLSIR